MSAQSSSTWELSRIPWQYFCTLTSRAAIASDDFHVKRSFAFVRMVAEKCDNVWFREVLFSIRTEPGEIGGRTHAHLLLGGLPVSYVSDDHGLWLAHCWMGRKPWQKSIPAGSSIVVDDVASYLARNRELAKSVSSFPSMGLAQVRPVFEVGGCVDYVLKRNGQDYEEKKFSRCGRLVVSNSVWRFLGVEPEFVGYV